MKAVKKPERGIEDGREDREKSINGEGKVGRWFLHKLGLSITNILLHFSSFLFFVKIYYFHK